MSYYSNSRTLYHLILDVQNCVALLQVYIYCRIGSDHNGTVIKAVYNGLGENVGIDDVRCEL